MSTWYSFVCLVFLEGYLLWDIFVGMLPIWPQLKLWLMAMPLENQKQFPFAALQVSKSLRSLCLPETGSNPSFLKLTSALNCFVNCSWLHYCTRADWLQQDSSSLKTLFPRFHGQHCTKLWPIPKNKNKIKWVSIQSTSCHLSTQKKKKKTCNDYRCINLGNRSKNPRPIR